MSRTSPAGYTTACSTRHRAKAGYIADCRNLVSLLTVCSPATLWDSPAAWQSPTASSPGNVLSKTADVVQKWALQGSQVHAESPTARRGDLLGLGAGGGMLGFPWVNK